MIGDGSEGRVAGEALSNAQYCLLQEPIRKWMKKGEKKEAKKPLVTTAEIEAGAVTIAGEENKANFA